MVAALRIMAPEREEDNFDTDLFINEIQQFPSIWDYTSQFYSNRIEKAKAWNAICCKFYEDFEGKDQKNKNECGKYVFIKHIFRTVYLCVLKMCLINT